MTRTELTAENPIGLSVWSNDDAARDIWNELSRTFPEVMSECLVELSQHAYPDPMRTRRQNFWLHC